MFRQQKWVTTLALPVLILLVTGAASAAPPDSRPGGLLLQSMEDRMQEWREGFLRFVAQHPDLTDEQLQAIQSLADIDDPRYFARSLDTRKREVLNERLGELGRVLAHSDYLKIIRSFGELRLWLIDNELATRKEADVPICNCNSSGDCASGVCENVTCIHQGGTTHTGVCKGSATELEL